MHSDLAPNHPSVISSITYETELPGDLHTVLSNLRKTLIKPEDTVVRRIVDYAMVGLVERLGPAIVSWLSVLASTISGEIRENIRILNAK